MKWVKSRRANWERPYVRRESRGRAQALEFRVGTPFFPCKGRILKKKTIAAIFLAVFATQADKSTSESFRDKMNEQ